MRRLYDGQKVSAIILPDGTKLAAGAPHEMEIYMENGMYCDLPWVRCWSEYEDVRYNCASLLAVILADVVSGDG